MAADLAVTLSILLGVVLCGLFTFLLFCWPTAGWNSGAPLPKGTFGWPIIGETFAITEDPLSFVISHRKRYGSIFKSSLFLRKTIVGTTSEFVKFVCLNPDLFKVQYPESVEFISPNAIFFGDGPRHIAVKKLFAKFTLPESLRTMVQTLEIIILENLASWEAKGTVLGSEVADELVADTSSYVSLGIKRIRSTPEGILAVKNMLTMIESIGSIPINIPGNGHNKGHKARDALRLYLISNVKQRMSQEDSESDILRILLDARAKAPKEEVGYYDEAKVVDEMVGAWFGAWKTTATTMAWTLKFLGDNPDIFKRIQAEQEEVLKGKDLSTAGPRLTWEDTRKMVYASKFYQETQRRLSISFLVPRKAAKDIVYDGLLIPKGWGVLPMLTFLHHDPANYEDPMTFNPDRFTTPPKPHTYLPFGLGGHRCPGEELTKLVFFIFVHHITTTYTYESIGPDRGVTHNGFPVIVGGYPIRVRRQI